MQKPLPLPDYRDLLRRELEERSRRNPKYSLRSFARDLDMAPARLSDVLRGRYGISRGAAEKIAKQIGLNTQETQSFCDLVEQAHSRSKQAKTEAADRLAARRTPYQELSLDAFHIVADWYPYAILELTLLRDFDPDPEWIARRLGLSRNVVKPALERLERLELIEFRDQTWHATDGFTASTSETPSAALKKFHQQILEKALAAVYAQNVDERDYSAVVMAIDKKDLPEAKEQIKNFRRGFDQKFGKAKNKNAIYCLSTQFFRLDEKE